MKTSSKILLALLFAVLGLAGWMKINTGSSSSAGDPTVVASADDASRATYTASFTRRQHKEGAAAQQEPAAVVPDEEIPPGWGVIAEADLPARFGTNGPEPLMMVGDKQYTFKEFQRKLRHASMEEGDRIRAEWLESELAKAAPKQ